MKQDKGDQDRIELEARHWAVYLHSGDTDPERLGQFEAWLEADPAHEAAFAVYQQLMTDLAMLPELSGIAPRIRPRIRPRIQPENREGVPAEDRPQDQSEGPAQAWTARPVTGRPRKAGRAAGLVMAAGAMAAVMAGLFLVQPVATVPAGPVPEEPGAYATRVAEIRDVILADGSRVTLGAASRIEPDFSDRMRVVTLLEGEAFFDVTPDPQRPFYVGAGDRLIRVVGTRFDVRQGRETVRIAVVEGVVELLKGDDPSKVETGRPGLARDVLRAGDEIVARIGSAETTLGAIEPTEAAPWRRGWLSYENASLREIVADANRYSRRQIVLVDDSLGDLRMTAAFSAEKIDQFAMGLEVSYGLAVDYNSPDRIVLSRAGGG